MLFDDKLISQVRVCSEFESKGVANKSSTEDLKNTSIAKLDNALVLLFKLWICTNLLLLRCLWIPICSSDV